MNDKIRPQVLHLSRMDETSLRALGDAVRMELENLGGQRGAEWGLEEGRLVGRIVDRNKAVWIVVWRNNVITITRGRDDFEGLAPTQVQALELGEVLTRYGRGDAPEVPGTPPPLMRLFVLPPEATEELQPGNHKDLIMMGGPGEGKKALLVYWKIESDKAFQIPRPVFQEEQHDLPCCARVCIKEDCGHRSVGYLCRPMLLAWREALVKQYGNRSDGTPDIRGTYSQPGYIGGLPICDRKCQALGTISCRNGRDPEGLCHSMLISWRMSLNARIPIVGEAPNLEDDDSLNFLLGRDFNTSKRQAEEGDLALPPGVETIDELYCMAYERAMKGIR